MSANNKELVGLFALPEDRVASREKTSRELPPHKKTEIDQVVGHRPCRLDDYDAYAYPQTRRL
jgi:hypothetical protein